MKSLINRLPLRGLAVVCPARGGMVLAPLGIIGLVCGGVLQFLDLLSVRSDYQATASFVGVVSVLALAYSVQCNPKGTRKSPLAF